MGSTPTDPRRHPIPTPPTGGPRRRDAAGAHAATPDPHGRRRRFLREVSYPHRIHPAIVPGVSVEDQKVRYGIDKVVLGTSAAAVLAFIAWGLSDAAQVTRVTTAMLTWVMANLGWLFNGIAVVILLIGGATALTGLQNLVTVSALPFAVVMIGMCVAVLRDFSTDPMMIRREFRQQALENAVREGVTEYGDDCKLAVEPAHGEAGQWAAGRDFESTAEEYTAWYQRTDEDGEPVAYDDETNE